MLRYKFLAALMALLMLGALAACGSDDDDSAGGGDGSSASANKDPLKVVLIPPASGNLAVFSKDATEAWELAAEQANANGGVAGHKVEIIKSETDGQPQSTIRAARRAAEQDDAHFIGAVISSPEHIALAQQLQAMGSLDINTFGKDDTLVGENCSDNHFMMLQTAGMDITALADSIKKMEGDKWAIQAVDYATGHTAAKEFKAAVEAAGKKVVLEQFAPQNTSEWGSYITKLKRSGADALFAVEYGADGQSFVTQGKQFDLFKQFKTTLGFNMVSEVNWDSLKPTVVGFLNNIGYVPELDNPGNADFVKAFEEKTGKKPYYVEADNYIGAQVLFAAVEKADSVDPEKVKEALQDIEVETIAGKVRMRPEDNQLLRPSYLGKIVEKDGELGWELVAEVSADKTSPQPSPDCKP